MTKTVLDKAEVSIDFPDKVYMGSFMSGSKVEARSEDDGLLIKLIKTGEQKRVVEMHLHHYVLADILAEWAESLKGEPPMEADHRKTLKKALKRVEKALK